jgi:hypothetical protein
MFRRCFTGSIFALSLLLTASLALAANVGDVVINELYMNSPDYYDGSEYIEIYNTTDSVIAIGGWALSSVEYDEICGEHYHVFPDTATIWPGSYIVVARDVADGDGFEDRFHFLPDYEMYDASQTSYEVDDPRVPNTIVNHDPFDDQIRLYPGPSDYAYRCPTASDDGRYEVVYLYTDSLYTTLIDAVEYTNHTCSIDKCIVNGTNDAHFGYPDEGYSLGRDESGSDTDDSSVDLTFQVATPRAQNINNIPPDIWTLRYSPCAPTTADSITVSCYAADVHGVQWVRCYYAVCAAPEPPDFTYGAYDSVTLYDVDGDSLYAGNLPPQPVDPTYLKFYVRASDNLGAISIFPDGAPDEPYNCSVGITPIADIQTVDIGADTSYYIYQAVNTSGVVTAEPGIYGFNTFVIQDGAGTWSGIFIYDAAGTTTVARGDSVTVSGWVSCYYGKTEIDLFSGCVTNHGPATVPSPTVVLTNTLSNSSLIAERYEGVLVRVEDVTVTNDSLGFGEWEVNDGSGPCIIGDYAYYVYEPDDGDELEAVQGIFDYYYEYRIEPRGDEDIVGPPVIADVRYSPHAPTASDVITVSATVTCADPIISVKTFFSTDDGASWDSTSMSTSDSVYTGDIGPFLDGSSVEYYVTAWSNQGTSGRRPSAGSYSLYVGRLSIYSIQTPAGGDSSAYAGEPVNTTGIVTAGTGTYSDYFFFIMEKYGGGSAEYRGVKVYDRTGSVSVARGDSVTVSGDVWEYFGETEISMPFPEAITVHSNGNAVPPAYSVSAGAVNTSEQWEGVLVTVNNATVTRPDNGFGEWTISTGGGAADTCVVGDIADYTYVPALSDVVIVTGISMYAYELRTLQPRDDDDICEPGEADVEGSDIPVRLAMSIFPNPMLSSGEIRLAIPEAGRVSVKVYDVGGRLVETLMERRLEAGEHSVAWDGANHNGRRVTPGIYFVKLETERGTVTKKMVLSR